MRDAAREALRPHAVDRPDLRPRGRHDDQDGEEDGDGERVADGSIVAITSNVDVNAAG